MRLYFAGGSRLTRTSAGGRARRTGIRDRLRAAEFWLEERAEALKLYAAGNVKAAGDPDAEDYAAGLRHRLLSYAFLDDWAKEAFEFWIRNRPDAVRVMLDSGAFSAKTRGAAIDLGAYCAYVERNRPALAAYFNLDVIGDPAGSQRNLEEMRRRGLDPLPVYHVNAEGVDVLHGILADGGHYIALGGMASDRVTRAERQAALDACWRVIERHWPVQVHGLGVMAQWALERYPWYSVDGSSAIVAAGMGRVMRWTAPRRPLSGLPRTRGRLVSHGWLEDAKAAGDGVVVDGVGRVAEGKGSDSAHGGRRRRNIAAQLAVERYVTDLWTAQGVTWQ